MLPGASGAVADAQQRRARADAGVTAILHETALVRYWDHDLGPDEQRLLVHDVLAAEDAWSGPGASGAATAGTVPAPRDLTPQPGRALDEQAFELTPDGRAAVTGWSVDDGAGGLRKDVVVIDTGTGDRRALLSAPGFDFTAPRVSPDGKRVVAIRERHESYDQASALTVVMVQLDAASRSDGASAAGPKPRTCCPGWSTGPRSWPGPRTARACSSSPRTTAADRCCGPIPIPGPSPA